MFVSTNVINLNYIHSSHLFVSPLCEEQSVFKRIANIAFHILTLGIPLAIYHRQAIQSTIHDAVSWCCSRFTSQSTHPYSLLGQKALEFAREELKKHPELAPTKFSEHPINPEIALLITLYRKVAFKNFEDVMKRNKENPWSNQEVIDAADACIKIAYAISNLTLDNLKSFTDELSSKGINRTYAQALTSQDSYPYRTFYYCTNAYHWLRGEIVWRVSVSPWSQDKEGLFYPQARVTEAHADLFYQKETIQNSWNRLYNEYCDRVRLYVNEEELRSADSRHCKWTIKDTGVKTFDRTPDTQPT